MKHLKKLFTFIILTTIFFACNESNNNYNGSYSMNINTFGVNSNPKVNLIVNGNKVKFDGEIYDCKQFNDRIEVGNGKATFSAVNGDLIINVPSLGKVKYLKISGDTNF